MYCTLYFIHIVNRIVSGEIYTAGKKFTLPPTVTALTNLTSAAALTKDDPRNQCAFQNCNSPSYKMFTCSQL